jgi:hypothetical protein
MMPKLLGARTLRHEGRCAYAVPRRQVAWITSLAGNDLSTGVADRLEIRLSKWGQKTDASPYFGLGVGGTQFKCRNSKIQTASTAVSVP